MEILNNTSVLDYVHESETALNNINGVQKDRKVETLGYIMKGNTRIQQSVEWNLDQPWSKEELACLQRIKKNSNEIEELVNIIKQLPEQETALKEIEQQLEDEPVPAVKVEIASFGRFSIINVASGAVIMTDKKDAIKSMLQAMYKMQPTTTTEVASIESEVKE